MKYADKMFYRGFAAALGTLARDFGAPHQAAMIAHQNGLLLESFLAADTDAYDTQAFMTELHNMETIRRKKKAKRKPKK